MAARPSKAHNVDSVDGSMESTLRSNNTPSSRDQAALQRGCCLWLKTEQPSVMAGVGVMFSGTGPGIRRSAIASCRGGWQRQLWIESRFLNGPLCCPTLKRGPDGQPVR